ncbi:MAG: butyrate kinase [Nitrospirae bacterium]|nr:butyrate kinase [Nitrospirota bacterium]
MINPRILVINPGSTSTKLAYFAGGEQVFHEELEHPAGALAAFPDIPSQEGYRYTAVERFLWKNGLSFRDVDAVAARGGLMKPVAGGVYRVNARMVEDLRGSKSRWGREHASNLGAMLALRIAEEQGVPAFTADPVTVDEMEDVARISGVPEITRKSHLHALNVKAAARRAARDRCADTEDENYVVAHMGGGITVAAVRGGRIIDVNNALLGMGPFSPQRAGALPVGDLVELCFSGMYDKEPLLSRLVKNSGMTGYLGTDDVREAERRIAGGDAHAALVMDAMAYQVAKEIAAMAAALHGMVDAVVLTGGVSHSVRFVKDVRARAGFVAEVLVYPGGFEMEALAEYAAAALTGKEAVLEYE